MGRTKATPQPFPGEIVKDDYQKVTSIDLSDEQVAWLRKHYATTSQKKLMQMMGVSLHSLYRIADKYGLKKDPVYVRKNRRKALRKAIVESRKSVKENGRRPSHRYGSVHVQTKQKGPFVVVATKLCKEDYDSFTNLVTLQGLTKHEVVRSLVKQYIKTTNASRNKCDHGSDPVTTEDVKDDEGGLNV